jgi:FixJ family two-component response regulator
MPESRAKIFIVDNEPDILASLRSLLEPLNYVVRAFREGHAFLAACEDDPPDCAILDVRLPDISGLAVQSTLAQAKPHLPVVFFTGYADVATAVRAMKAGAVDYIEKPASELVLLEAVQGAIRQAREAERMRAEIAAVRQRLDRLTEREREILEQILGGGSAKEIAQTLSLSPRTVETHRAKIMAKTGANSIAHLVWMAVTAGVLDPSAVAMTACRDERGC